MSLISTLFGWLFLQSYIHLPNGYQMDVEREPPRFAAPCDRHNVVAVRLPVEQYIAGGKITLRYDREDRSYGEGASGLRLRMQWEWE